MRNQRRVARFSLLAMLCALAMFSRRAQADELILCGWDEVFIVDIDPASPPAQAPKKIWTWKVADSPRIPAQYKNMFRSTDECKPVAGGKQILITSSSGGVALIERETKKALFWAYVGNAHSAEMLPGGRIAVAGSGHKDGNCLALFDVKQPEKRLYTDELKWGHGAVWDPERQILWASGGDDLRAYTLKDWQTDKPSLKREAVYKFPDVPNAGAHDLIAVPGTNQLFATSHHHVYLFDCDKRTFSKHPKLYEQARVKGAAIHPRTKRLAYTQGSAKHWSTDRLRWAGLETETVFSGERLYKARWIIPPQKKNPSD